MYEYFYLILIRKNVGALDIQYSLDYSNQLEPDVGRINDNPDHGYSNTCSVILNNAYGKKK